MDGLNIHVYDPRTWRDRLRQLEDPLDFVPGLDDAIIGFCADWHNDGAGRVVYDCGACVEALIATHGWPRHEAQDYFDTCVLGKWTGPNGPVFVWTE